MKKSLILGTALAMALAAAPAMAGNLDALKNSNGTALTTTELASVEGKMRRSRGGLRVVNRAYVSQHNVCVLCLGVYQGNNNYTSQRAKVKVINISLRFGGIN